MINQKNREEVIKLLDNSEENVTLEDLFLFDLSPYYNEKIDDSFFSKQLEFIQEKNQLNHNPSISFTPEQTKIYKDIENSERIIISAPTSFGKTMLVKEYIYNYEPNIIVFIVPTNSLADELLFDFTELYSDLGYVIFDSIKNIDAINDKSIFIGTQEKYYQLLEYYTTKIDLFVIDEAYKLTDPIKNSREVVLNRSFVDSISNVKKIVLLMPLVNSINGLNQLNFKISQSDYAPVAKNFTSVSKLKERIKEDVMNNSTTNLIYFSSPKDLEKFYLKHLKEVDLSLGINDDWIKRVEEDFHPDWLPIYAIKSGIGIHYGPMPKFIQRKVSDLFKEEILKNLLSTSSIIEGVNTPTKNIYITTSRDILNSNTLVKYKNLIGRAGRLGQHKVGNIYYDKKHQKQFEKANIPYQEIDISFVLDNRAEVIEINREDSVDATLDADKDSANDKSIPAKSYLEHSNYKNVPQAEISKLLNKHGFTVNQLKILLEYIEQKNIYFLGIIGKLLRKKIDTDCLNITLNHRFQSFTDMFNELSEKKVDVENSQIVSLLIDMIYSEIPFKIIPLINFTIDINNLFREYNDTNLISDKVIEDANKIKAQFYSKFIGEIDGREELLMIMNKLFEYGVSYQRAKPHIEIISENVPNKFSIYDLKKIIFENESMNELRIYFE